MAARERLQRRALGSAAAVTLLTACGGGVDVTPVSGPNSATLVTTIATAAGVPDAIALPPNNGFSGTLTLTSPLAIPGTRVVISDGSAPPAGAPEPVNGDTPLFFVGIDVASGITLTGSPAFTFTVPGSVTQNSRRPAQSDSVLRVDAYDPANPSAGYQPGTTCTQNGTTVTCPAGSLPFTLASGSEGVFELGIAPSGGLTFDVPSPAPMTCAPASVTVLLGQSNVIDCSEPGYAGSFAVAVADPSIASVQQSNDLTFDFFTVTGLAAGSTTATLRSGAGVAVTVPITVVP